LRYISLGTLELETSRYPLSQAYFFSCAPVLSNVVRLLRGYLLDYRSELSTLQQHVVRQFSYETRELAGINHSLSRPYFALCGAVKSHAVRSCRRHLLAYRPETSTRKCVFFRHFPSETREFACFLPRLSQLPFFLYARMTLRAI
jgi:hypothetical protein